MSDKQVLMISFWNPTPQDPQKGIFIQDQAEAVCRLRENIVFLQVNILAGNSLFLKKTVQEHSFYNGIRITINLYSLLWKFLYINPWWSARIIYRVLQKKRDKINPAIIHANVIYPCGIAGYILARRTGARFVISEHWSKANKLLGHPFYKRIALRAYRYSFALICVSDFLSRDIIRRTGHMNGIVIPNIISTGLFTYVPKQFNDNRGLCFTCVASWRPPKRLDLIIESLSYYASETNAQIILNVVGNGRQADAFKNRMYPENLHIEWFGYLEKPKIAALLHDTNIFMHASNIETFSIVTVEALTTGTPVIASNTGALPELINENNGVIVENNPESWLRGIREIVAKKYNYEAIAIQNRNKYSPDEIGRQILSVYNAFDTFVSDI
jgi:glycosyltransferase involved in cell wall biosynthesis